MPRMMTQYPQERVKSDQHYQNYECALPLYLPHLRLSLNFTVQVIKYYVNEIKQACNNTRYTSLVYALSPLILLASWISFGIMVTRLA